MIAILEFIYIKYIHKFCSGFVFTVGIHVGNSTVQKIIRRIMLHIPQFYSTKLSCKNIVNLFATDLKHNGN